MTIVVVGTLADTLGAASQLVTIPYRGRERTFDVERRWLSVPSTEYRSVQPATIQVDVDHDRPIGQVKYLERSAQRLYAVCEIDASGLGDGPWYYSPSIRHYGGTEIELRGLAVTRSPATVGLAPLAAFPGTLDHAAYCVVTRQDGHPGELVKRARAYDRQRKHSEPLVIQGVQPNRAPAAAARAADSRQAGRLEYRSATPVAVSRARRELDLLIVPAEQPTRIHEPGRSYTEIFSHGAFAGVEQNLHRVRVNRDHVRERVLGKAVRLDPWNEDGLTGTVKLARTREGDDALALIDDDLLGVSASFGVPPGGDEWRDRSSRRVRRAVLDHIALVAEPAYPGAKVLGTRSLSAR